MGTTSKFKRIFFISFWSLFLLGVCSIFFLFFAVTKGWLGYLPDLDELQNPKNKYATEIYTSDMQLLGTYFYEQGNRVSVHYQDISPNMIQALVATEDARFTDHSGIDGRALARAIIKRGVLMQKNAGGGSTITQQLAKQLYSPHARNIIERAMQKPIEWVIAVQLERLYSKQEIITMYLNQFDFNNNAVGIKSAAKVYFNTTPDKLKMEEAATLVGMCKNPWYFNPVSQREVTRENTRLRRNTVFSQMEKMNYLTQMQVDSLSQLPLGVKFNKVDHKLGPAPYFREYLKSVLMAKKPEKKNYAAWQQQKYKEDVVAWENNPLFGFCNKNKKNDGTPYNIYSDGLRIYTTIDSRMQHYAENAVDEHMKALQQTFFDEKKGRSYAPFSSDLTLEQRESILNRNMRQTDRYRTLKKQKKSNKEIVEIFNTPVEMKVFTYHGTVDTLLSPMDSIKYYKHFLRCGFMSVDARTGYVKAYVGGPDFGRFQYDMVTGGRRQVGSTVKPFLYTLAMEEGMHPCDTITNQPITLMTEAGEEWTPRNSSDDRLGETVSLQWGLTTSNNWISAYLMSQYTPQSLVKLMRSFGIQGQLDPVLSLCLGPCEITVEEMVRAYTAFSNKGIRVDPIYVTRIEDANGNVIGEFTPNTYEIFSEATSCKMVGMLQSVINNGSGIRVRYRYGLRMEMGGKTGTTQNNSDGWFMGFTPSLVSGVWVGGEDRGIHFDNIVQGQGANMALPIWALYMQQVLANPDLGYSTDESFNIPEDVTSTLFCHDSPYVVVE